MFILILLNTLTMSRYDYIVRRGYFDVQFICENPVDKRDVCLYFKDREPLMSVVLL